MAALPSARQATLREKVKRLTGAGKNFVLDVKKLDYIHSPSLGPLVAAFECELPGTWGYFTERTVLF